MYMNTRANLHYWSTDNCCLKWSLSTGALTIGAFSVVWQALVMSVAVLMLVTCPSDSPFSYPQENFTTFEVDYSLLEGEELSETENSSLLVENNTTQTNSSNITANATILCVWVPEPETSSIGGLDESKCKCVWVPEPETSSIGGLDDSKLLMVACIVLTYSSIYFVLSVCVIIGVLQKSARFVKGWVAFTSVHNMLIIADLLITLPFTTLTHLLSSIVQFAVWLYMWAVVKSYLHSLKLEKDAPVVPEGATTDFTVDGVDIHQVPVQV